MSLDIRDAVYSGISQQFPAIYQEDGDFLVSFVQSYYEYLDGKNDRNLPKLRDIDTTLSTFLIYYKKKFLADLPIDTKLDVRYIIKHIQDVYRRKGTQESLELLFRMFFDEDIEVFYPSTSILRPSDSIWGGDAYLEMRPVFTVDEYPVEKGMRIRGDSSLATAFVDEVIFVNFSGALIPIVYLSNIAGTFNSDDGIMIVTTDADGSESVNNVGRLISGSIDSINVTTSGATRLPDQEIGDNVKIVSRSTGSGVEGEGRVTAISDTTTGVIDFTIIDGGFGYVDPSTTTLTVKNDIGVSNQVMVLSGEAKDIQRNDIVMARGELVTYSDTGVGNPIPYTLTGSAKVIEYNHPLIFLYSDDFDTVSTFLNQTAVPVAGPNLGGAPTNVFIETMRNVQHKVYNDAAPSPVGTPRFMPSEYSAIYKGLQKKNQRFLNAPSGNVADDALAFLQLNDVVPYSADDYAEITLSAFGVGSRTILQEYLNVMNITGKFPVFDGSIYGNNDLTDLIRNQWQEYLESVFLALSKVGYYPQMTIGRPKAGITEIPNVQTSIVSGQRYMIWDNNDTNLFANYHNGTQTHEGYIFVANQSLDFLASTSTDELAVIPASGSDGYQGYTDDELTNLHLNRLRYDAELINNLSNSTAKRLRDKSGVAIDYPSLTSPSFDIRRYRGDLARYDSSVQNASDLEAKVFLDNIPLQSFGVRNNSASYEVGSLSNLETVTLIPDLIEDFSDTQLDIGDDGVIAGDDYGMSGPGAENFNTVISDAFSPITLRIGTIDSLNILNNGTDYQNDVASVIENLNITKFNKKDVILNFDVTDFDISVGDIITQDIQIPDLQINQAGNRLHDDSGDGVIFLEKLGSVTSGSNYQNSNTTFDFTSGATKKYEVKAKFLKREGNDYYFRPLSFYGFEGNTTVFGMKPDQEYVIVASGNTSLSDWQAVGAQTGTEGEIFTSVDSETTIANTIQIGDRGTISVPVSIGGSKKRITRIFEDQNSQPMGANAEIGGTALYQTGQISEVVVTKTGFRYGDREIVDIVNNEPNSANYNKVIAEAQLRTLGQGKTGGKWRSKTSFLSESSKSLHDNNFFQEYSYEISSIVNPAKYESLIKETVGVAGTKIFSKPLVNSSNNMFNDLNLEISTFNIQGIPLSSVNTQSVAKIEAGTTYTIFSAGNTSVTQWENLGADVDTTQILGLANLLQNEVYRIDDIGSAGWDTVQYLSPESRQEWWMFWVDFIGLNQSGGEQTIVPDYNGSGTGDSSDLLIALKQITGIDPITPATQAKLDLITDGLVINNSFNTLTAYNRFQDRLALGSYPVELNTMSLTQFSIPVGSDFVAAVDGQDITGVDSGNGIVSYKEAVFVMASESTPQDIRVAETRYTDLDGNSVIVPRIQNVPVDNKYYIVHSIERLADIVPDTAQNILSMDLNDVANTINAGYWNDIIDSSETAVDHTDSNTYPRVGTIFKADSVGNKVTYSTQLGDAQVVDINDVVIEFSDTDVSSDYVITKTAHGLGNDTLVQYNQYLGTSSGNLIGNPTSNRQAEYEWYYVVNRTDDTFSLSRTPMSGSDTHVPIDLSGITGGPHLLVPHSVLLADDAVLIGIQEQ